MRLIIEAFLIQALGLLYLIVADFKMKKKMGHWSVPNIANRAHILEADQDINIVPIFELKPLPGLTVKEQSPHLMDNIDPTICVNLWSQRSCLVVILSIMLHTLYTTTYSAVLRAVLSCTFPHCSTPQVACSPLTHRLIPSPFFVAAALTVINTPCHSLSI